MRKHVITEIASAKEVGIKTSITAWFFSVLLMPAIVSAQLVPGQNGDWNANANGNWSTGPWTALAVGTDYPSGVGARGLVIQNITATRTITLDVPVTLGTLMLGDTNNTSAFILSGGTLTFDNGGAANADNGGVIGAFLNHNSATAGMSPSSSDRIESSAVLNDLLTINADRNLEFRGAWDGGGNDIVFENTGRIYWNNNTGSGVLSNVGTLTINEGEARFDGLAGSSGNLVGAADIVVGNGILGFGTRAFARLFLVNTEATQTANISLNGGWFVNDLGNNDQTFTGNLTVTGTADTNIIDLNDPGSQEQHLFTGVIGGTGGFSKINTGAMILINNNTFQGNMYVQRGRGTNLGSVHLSGVDGAVSAAAGVYVSRDGSVYLDNSIDVNSNRIGDSTDLILRGAGRMRFIGNGAAAVSESMGDYLVDTGSGRVNFDLDDTTPQNLTLTFASFNRHVGAVAQFQVLDNTPGAFGTTAQLHFTDAGASATQFGGGGVNGSTNMNLVVGAFGGVNDVSNHFMTFDSAAPTLLRPLDFSTEYLLSQNLVDGGVKHTLNQATLGGVDQNVMINYNTVRAIDPDPQIDWYAPNPIRVTENVGMNSLRFGTNTPTAGTNTNELGSTLSLTAGVHLYLGDSLAATNGIGVDTDGSGMILFGRDVDGTNPGSNQFITGGFLDFGSREAILVNESGNSAFIRSNISGTGGLTKAGANTIYLDNTNSYSGTTTVAEGVLDVRDQGGLGTSDLVQIEGSGALYLEFGTVLPSTVDLRVGVLSSSHNVLRSNGGNNTFNGDIIVDNVDNLGNLIYTPYINVGTGDTLNLNGTIYGALASNPLSQDTTLNDARIISTNSSSAGIININGTFQDNILGAGTGIIGATENELLRFQIGGNDQLIVNVRNQWNAAGNILLERGYLRYEGDGNFWTDDAASAIVPTNSQSGMRLSGSISSNAGNINLVLTKDGQKLNIDRIDIGGNGSSDNYNDLGNITLAGTNTSGTVTFGNGVERIVYGSSDAARAHNRDLSVYAAGGGTVNLDFRLDDTDTDVHTSFTKIGRGVVNYNSAGTLAAPIATNGDVEQLNLSGGLLRLTNYGGATGTRFDNGAMVVFAGGGIEMDGVGSVANETANYTGAAVGVHATFTFPTAETIVNPGGTDVIVTSDVGRTTTMNIGSAAIPLTRAIGGTLHFVENANGGASVITLSGNNQPTSDLPIAWATYGDSYTFNAAQASYSLNALDFAMITGVNNDVAAFAGVTREDTDDVSLWVNGNDVSEGVAGFSGTTAVGANVNTLHFDQDGASTLTLDAGGLVVNSGGVMVNSLVATAGSIKTISGGPLSAGVGNDLIVHHYGAGLLVIESELVDNGGTALVKTGTGAMVLNGANSYSGGTFFNGGSVSISADTNLGAGDLYFNGGALHTTADMTLDPARSITLGGNGGELSVADGTTLTYGGFINEEPNLIAGYAANPAVGRIDKTGTGTLLWVNDADNSFAGLLDIKEGTLSWAPTTVIANNTVVNPFGTNNAFLDGTIVRSGATLDISPASISGTTSNLVINEWMTFEAGSTLNVAQNGDDNRGILFRGVLQFDSKGLSGGAGATIVDVNRNSVHFNDDGGFLLGDGNILKMGGGNLYLREPSPDWTGQMIIAEGAVYSYSAGQTLGSGTASILLGHDGTALDEPTSGTSLAALYFRDEGGYRDSSSISQDIIVRNENGLGNQTKRLGALYLAHVDEANFDGDITLLDDVEFYYQDDARNSAGTSTADVRNDTRSNGAPTNSETVFINFNGNISGTRNVTINVAEGGNGNIANGSITAPNDDLVLRPTFGLNGDNSAWTGVLTLGETTSDIDTNHIVSFGNDLAIGAQNDVVMRNNATLQTSGHNVIIGSLTMPNSPTTESYIENASTTAGSITITQSVDAVTDLVIRDGVNFFALQPGEVDSALSFVKAGTAMLTLTKENSFSGTTTLNGGTLQLAYDADNSMLSDTASLILNDGILDLAGTVAHSETVLDTTINGTVAITRSTGSSTINLNALTRNAGSLRISEDNVATTDTLNDATGILGGWATVGGSWATNSTNGPDGFIVGLTTFSDIDRLGGTIPNGSLLNARIIEAGTTGQVTLAGAGTTTVNTLLQGADGGVGVDAAVVDIGAGNILRIASGGVLLPDGSSALTFTHTGMLTVGAIDDTAGTLFLQNQNTVQQLTVGTTIANNGTGVVNVRTTGPGTTIFTGTNSYTGDTLIGSGTLALGDGGITGELGGGTVTIEGSGTLAFNRSDTALNVANQITGNGVVTQIGSGTTTLSGSSSGSALSFVMAAGTLATGVDDAINTTGSLIFGATYGGTETGALDLTNGGVTAGGLLVQTNTVAANQITIGVGKTLTVNGDVTIGVNIANDTNSALAISGGGSFVVNRAGGTFQVGGATGTVNGNKAVLDMSGLGAFTANMGTTGVFRVGDSNSNSAGTGNALTTVTLAADSTITAGSIGVGDHQGIPNGAQTLNLGTGTNILNADLIHVGDLFGNRGTGVLQFADTTGTLIVRGSDGSSRSSMNVVNSVSGTGFSFSGTVDLAGHDADLLLDALVIGRRTSGTGGATAAFTFDTGTLDVNSVVLGYKTGAGGASTVSGTMNIGGGTVAIGAGGISMASNGGTTASTAAGTLNFTGGIISVDGDIVHEGATGAGNTTATLNLGGTASLDMLGHSIGDATNPIALTIASGTLANVAEINGGAGLLKYDNGDVGGGTLILEGNNTYTGGTNVNAGILQVGTGGTTGTLGSGPIVADGILRTARDGTFNLDQGITGFGNIEINNAATGLTVMTNANSYAGTTSVNSGTLQVGAGGTGASMLNATAAGTTGTGAVTVTPGGMIVGSGVINGALTVGGAGVGVATLNPGDAGNVGTLWTSGDVTLADNSALQFSLVSAGSHNDASLPLFVDAGYSSYVTANAPTWETSFATVDTTSGNLYDHLDVGGQFDFGTGLTNRAIDIDITGYTAMHGDIFNLVDWVTAVGAAGFDVGPARQGGELAGTYDLNLPDLGSGFEWDTSQFTSAGILVVAGVPEPGRLLLIFFGLALASFRRRRV